MASDVGQAYVSIVPSLKGFSTKLKAELVGELRGIDSPISQAGQRAGRGFGDNLREGLRTKLAGIGAMLKTGLVIGGAAVAAGLGALTVFGLRSAASLEQTQIGIESLLGSAEEARSFISELQQFAAQTPFGFAEVADASRRILAFGDAVGITRDQVLPTLTTIGDLVSVLGGGTENISGILRALGQIASKGRLMGGEVLQLTEQLPGFNVNAAIAAHLGVSVAESLRLQEAGAIDARTAIEGLLEGMAEFPGAAGAMERQAGTLQGVFSTFQDTIAIALSSAFAPIIPEIKQVLTDITPILGDVIGELAPLLGQVLATVLPLVAGVVTALVPIINPILDAVSETLPTLVPALAPLGEVIGQVLQAVAPLLPILGTALAGVVMALIPAIADFIPQIEAMVPAFAEIIPPLTEVLIALLPLIPAFLELATAFTPLLVALAPVVADLLSLVALDVLVPIVDALAGGIGYLADGIRILARWLGGIDWGNVWGAITSAVSGAWDSIVGFFRDLPGNVVSFLTDLPSRLATAASTALSAMAYAVGFGIGAVIAFFRDAPGKVIGFLKELPGKLRDWATEAGDSLKTKFSEAIDAVVGFFSELPGKAVAFFSELPGEIREKITEIWDDLVNIGKRIVQGIISGIRNAASGIGQALRDAAGSALSGLRDALGIHSPSTVYAEVGEQTIAGYVQGVQRAAKAAQAAQVAALTPAAATPAPAAVSTPQVVTLTSSDPLWSRLLDEVREQVRRQYGGDVVLALSTAGV